MRRGQGGAQAEAEPQSSAGPSALPAVADDPNATEFTVTGASFPGFVLLPGRFMKMRYAALCDVGEMEMRGGGGGVAPPYKYIVKYIASFIPID